MSFIFEPRVQEPYWAPQLCNQAGEQVDPRTRCADKSFAAAFPGEVTQVAVINVDKADMEVLLSGQEGICVQCQ